MPSDNHTAVPVAGRAADLSFARDWPTVMFVGIVTIAAGVVVLAWPDKTLAVLSVLFGIQLLLFGLFRLISAFEPDVQPSGLVGLVGVIGIVVGVVVLRHPYDAVVMLATLLGVVWIVSGAIDVIAAMADSTITDRWLMAFSGALSIGAGVLVVAWPEPSVTVIAWIAGLYFITFGVVISVSAFRLRSMAS